MNNSTLVCVPQVVAWCQCLGNARLHLGSAWRCGAVALPAPARSQAEKARSAASAPRPRHGNNKLCFHASIRPYIHKQTKHTASKRLGCAFRTPHVTRIPLRSITGIALLPVRHGSVRHEGGHGYESRGGSPRGGAPREVRYMLWGLLEHSDTIMRSPAARSSWCRSATSDCLCCALPRLITPPAIAPRPQAPRALRPRRRARPQQGRPPRR